MTSPAGPAFSFRCPPTWPQPPAGWTPPAGWQPDPAWGPAPEGWQFWQLREPTPQEAPVDGFAVATLVAGVLGSVIFAAIFGGVALSRIRRGLRRGRNLVVIGWVVCGLWVVGGIGVLWMVAAQAPGRAPSGTVTSAGKVAPMALQVGDCVRISGPASGLVPSVDAIPCGSPHNAQVFAVASVGDVPFPGDDEAVELGLQACQEELPGFFGDGVDIDPELRLVSFTSPRADWERGDHTARCLLRDPSGDFTGDIRDH